MNDDLSSAADRFHSAAIHALRYAAREDPASGLSAARLSALSVLVFGGPKTLGELAATEQVRPPTMTRIIHALEADGCVRRTSDPDDRRVTHVWLTPKANRIRAGLLKLARGINMQAEQGIPREDIAAFRRAILRMTANLDRVGQ